MKFTVVALGLLFSFNVLAVEQELTLKSKADGQPSFGIQYAYDVDFAWSFTYATTISNKTLASIPNSIFWNILDTKKNQLITKWTETDKASLMVGSIGISDRMVVTSLLPVMKMSKIIYGVMNPQGTIETLFSIPLSSLCQNYPTHIVDLTNTSAKACEVKAQDIPDNQSECKDWESELLDYVNQGLLTCEIAKKQYAKKGCGVLSCQ
jgi:hypothetical protein